jgi:hypothetical protein
MGVFFHQKAAFGKLRSEGRFLQPIPFYFLLPLLAGYILLLYHKIYRMLRSSQTNLRDRWAKKFLKKVIVQGG